MKGKSGNRYGYVFPNAFPFMIILTPHLIHNYRDCLYSNFMTLYGHKSWKKAWYYDDSGQLKKLLRLTSGFIPPSACTDHGQMALAGNYTQYLLNASQMSCS
jgi:hypothetical protein